MEYRYQLKMADTDAAGRMFFLAAGRIAHESFEQLLATLGFGLRRILAELPFVLPIVRLEADYREPLYLEEWLTVETGLARLGERSLTLRHQLRKDSGRVAVVVTITHVAVAKETGQAMPLPAELRQALLGLT
jgi:1,4-dihydroxy-2-naphthoyl-CoA hydrolase